MSNCTHSSLQHYKICSNHKLLVSEPNMKVTIQTDLGLTYLSLKTLKHCLSYDFKIPTSSLRSQDNARDVNELVNGQ